VVHRPLMKKHKRRRSSKIIGGDSGGGSGRLPDAEMSPKDMEQTARWLGSWWKDEEIVIAIPTNQEAKGEQGARRSPAAEARGGDAVILEEVPAATPSLDLSGPSQATPEDMFLVEQARRCLIYELQAAAMRVHDLTQSVEMDSQGMRRLQLSPGGDRALAQLVEAMLHILLHGFSESEAQRLASRNSDITTMPIITPTGSMTLPATPSWNRTSSRVSSDSGQTAQWLYRADSDGSASPVSEGAGSSELHIHAEYFAQSTVDFLDVFQKLIRGVEPEHRVHMAEVYAVIDASMLGDKDIQSLEERLAQMDRQAEQDPDLMLDAGVGSGSSGRGALRERAWIAAALIEGKLYDVLEAATTHGDRLSLCYEHSALLRTTAEGREVLEMIGQLKDTRVAGNVVFIVSGGRTGEIALAEEDRGSLYMMPTIPTMSMTLPNPMAMGTSVMKSSMQVASYITGTSSGSGSGTGAGASPNEGAEDRPSDLFRSTFSSASRFVMPKKRRASAEGGEALSRGEALRAMTPNPQLPERADSPTVEVVDNEVAQKPGHLRFRSNSDLVMASRFKVSRSEEEWAMIMAKEGLEAPDASDAAAAAKPDPLPPAALPMSPNVEVSKKLSMLLLNRPSIQLLAFRGVHGETERPRLSARVSNYRIQTVKAAPTTLSISGGKRVVVYELAVGFSTDEQAPLDLPSLQTRSPALLGNGAGSRLGAGLGPPRSPAPSDAGSEIYSEREDDDDDDDDDSIFLEDDEAVFTPVPVGRPGSPFSPGSPGAGAPGGTRTWCVNRRYNDFKKLHEHLRGQLSSANFATLPRLPEKKMMFNYDEKFILKRGRALDLYVTQLLEHPIVSTMHELYQFLLPSGAFHRGFGQGLDADADGAEDGGVKVHIGRAIDDVSFLERASEDGAALGVPVASPGSESDGARSPSPANTPDQRPPSDPGAVSFSISKAPRPLGAPSASHGEDAPSLGHASSQDAARAGFKFDPRELRSCESAVFGLAKELFQLNRSGIARRSTVSFLRRAARMLFSSSMISALEASYEGLATSAKVTSLLKWLRELLFPGGEFMTAAELPSEEEQVHARNNLCARLPGVLPSALTALVGHSTAVTGAMHFFEFIQCPVLLRSVMYTLLDLLFCEIFPNMEVTVFGMQTIEIRKR